MVNASAARAAGRAAGPKNGAMAESTEPTSSAKRGPYAEAVRAVLEPGHRSVLWKRQSVRTSAATCSSMPAPASSTGAALTPAMAGTHPSSAHDRE